MEQLNDDQRARVEQIASGRGLACQQCGSALESTGFVGRIRGGNRVVVGLHCTNREGSHTEGLDAPSLVLSDAEARELDI